MHKSKLAGFIIDCNTQQDLSDAARFWADALGLELRELPGQEGERYVRLLDDQHGLHIEVQSVEHPSRVHLDIETDDIEAEVKRLEQLGATRVGAVNDWCVMEAPSGQRFCVVKRTTENFDSTASRWD